MIKKCKKCGGSGIIYDRNIEAGSVGELKLCECVEKQCSCNGLEPYQIFDDKGNQDWCPCRTVRMKLARVKKAFKESQIPRKYMWKFVEDFEIVNDVAQRLISIPNLIRENSAGKGSGKGYYLWGNAGSGKTLLACIILQELMLKHGQRGIFIDLSRQFFRRLKRSYDVTDELYGREGQIMDELIEVPFLVIDDFGVQRNTEWESETLYNLVDSRYEQERLTILTSNIHISSFKNIAYGRVYSRIMEMCNIVKVDLPDYRENFKREHNFT